MIAYLTNRTFQIGDRSPLPRIEDVFISPHINWSRPSEPEWIIEPLKFRANPRNYNSSVLDSHEYYAVNTIEDYKLLDRLLRFDLNEIMNKEAWTTLISINRGKTIRMFENQKHITRLNATGLTPSTAFGCIVNYLIKPKPEVFLPVLDQLHTMATLTPDTLKIGIQIRTGDRTMGNSHHAPVDDYAGFFNCAKEIEHFALTANPQYKKAIWYLITDLKSVREDAVAKFGDKILTSVNVHIEHSSKEESVCKNGNCGNVTLYGFSTAAAEWWMFSMADYFVISEYSGFGRSAAMHSLKTSSIYTIPWKRMKAGVSCSNESYTQLENLSYEWSGI